MKTVILGAGGQLATDLEKEMADWELYPLTHADLDICHHEKVRERLTQIQPEAVINTAAFHRVDDCEEQVEKAFRVNTYAVRNLAQVCADLDCRLMHISTDYVFDGEKRTPYTEEDLPNPLNVYGVSKLAGEYFVRNTSPKHFVVRTSGLYGVAGSSGKGSNFVEMMLVLAESGQTIRVVNDQVLSPTSTRHLCGSLRELALSDDYGLYHLTTRGHCSWYEFASEIFSNGELNPHLEGISSEQYNAAATRPKFSALECSKLSSMEHSVTPLPHWNVSLRDYLKTRNSRTSQ